MTDAITLEQYLSTHPKMQQRLEQCRQCKWFTGYNPPQLGNTPVFGKCRNPEGPLINEKNVCDNFKQKWEGRVDMVMPNLASELEGVGIRLKDAQKSQEFQGDGQVGKT